MVYCVYVGYTTIAKCTYKDNLVFNNSMEGLTAIDEGHVA